MRVLVVEDDPGIAELVSDELQALGYAVDLADDGEQALSLLAGFPFDLVVLDVVLPGRDGFDVVRTLRGRRQAVPVLMLTARGGVDDRVRGLELGADDYLGKPFHLSELRARARALLRRAAGEASNQLEVGRVRLDLAQRRAWFGDAELLLSGTEYALLEFLAHHPGGYFTRERLLEHAWSASAAIDPRTVDTYIRYLRRKLADDAIETRRGIGYRLRG